MIVVENVLVSDEIVEKHFKCNLTACKGACCWEGDYGAPLTELEAEKLSAEIELLLPHLDEEARKIITKDGVSKYYKEAKMLGTPLLKNKRCVYLTPNDSGIYECMIEKKYNEGVLTINKPISCHLYPIRVIKNETQNFEAWNYDQWDICSPACKQGKKEGIKIYEFLKSAIIRYKGEDFYDELDAAANHILSK
jgi:hypothetical protein